MRNQCSRIIFFSLILILSAALPAMAGTVSITTLQYPAAPETLSVGERVPIVVRISYANMEQSTLSLHLAYADYPPRFQGGGEVKVSGSGTYLFSPAEIMVPASYSMPSGWPKYINEWHLKAEIWKGDKLRSSKSFTLLVENPEYRPEVEISQIDYVVSPDTIAVGEKSLVKVHVIFSNLGAGTKIKATLSDPSGLLDSGVSRPFSGSGTVTFTMTVKPKSTGHWVIDAVLATTTGTMPLGDTKQFAIKVI